MNRLIPARNNESSQMLRLWLPPIFISTFLQSLSGGKNSILNWVIQLDHFMYFFFVFETPLKDFPFYSPILLTLWFRYFEARIKESCIYLASHFFFKTLHKTLKFQRFADLNFKNISFAVYHRATQLSYWIKQTVKKLNL